METSPISSRTSSPDSQRRSSRHDSIGSSMSGGSTTPQINFLQKQKELREQLHQQQVRSSTGNTTKNSNENSTGAVKIPLNFFFSIKQQASPHSATSSSSSPQSPQPQYYSPDKPPIPPRGYPPPVPQRQSSNDNMNVTLRNRNHSGSGMFSDGRDDNARHSTFFFSVFPRFRRRCKQQLWQCNASVFDATITQSSDPW